jgi:hypothetical protein
VTFDILPAYFQQRLEPALRKLLESAAVAGALTGSATARVHRTHAPQTEGGFPNRRRSRYISDRICDLAVGVFVIVIGVLSAKLRSTEPGRRGSEAVALRHPVMPVANSLGSGLVGINGNQL